MSGSLLLLFVFLSAFLAPPLSRLLRMPVPVGELVIGLLLGHFLAQGVALPEILGFLADFGFLLLMFLAGLEVDFNLLRQLERRHFVFYALYVVGMFLGAGLLAGLLGVGLAQALILALVSIGLMVATLRDMGILGRAFAKRVLILGVLGEVASLFGLTAMEKAAHYQGLLSLLKEVGIIALFFLLLFLAFRLAGLFLWWYPEVGRRLVYEEDPSAMGIRLSLALMFAAAVMSGLVGLESVLGAFLAGMILSYFLQKKHDLEAKLSAMGYGFLIPIFFIRTGGGPGPPPHAPHPPPPRALSPVGRIPPAGGLPRGPPPRLPLHPDDRGDGDRQERPPPGRAGRPRPPSRRRPLLPPLPVDGQDAPALPALRPLGGPL